MPAAQHALINQIGEQSSEEELGATAAAQRDGHIGAGHLRVIRDFFRHLPVEVDVEIREKAEAHLARLATRFGPDQLAKLAQRLMDCLNLDGTFTDKDRARRRGLTLGKQGLDGMSCLSGWLAPEARATSEAVLAKLAAAGMCNPGGRESGGRWSASRRGGVTRHP
ncbi:hypothetical protein B1987_01570 [Mycobacterium kansasii]|uniref:DUF222 domain-containing protein n=1 Tax=Mycobacterium attenuatum TaxID=2341086 RepID=A0A498Q4X7_9MYCO|nr:hypothetical protein B1987_01570 [Mycobacterium kansasii]VBA39602.1 hypothetical protein LAUMK136_03087 [Mycobacterium attenuatum]VBA54163.1 hypothetical protein LAUMK191_03058 [Mycobacterium attenuatum]VBA58723.1 hypothetical protein LAUMK41_03134 [Mycobacterium attenuatum]